MATMGRSSRACLANHSTLRGVAAFGVLSLSSVSLQAATYYVAPTGNNASSGTTIDQPFATMDRAQQAAVAGDTVYFRGGTYLFTSTTAADGVALNKSGTAANRIKYWAYQNEVPIFDFSGMTAALRITGLRVTASWIHLKGIEIKLVPQNITTQNESWGIYNLGSNNIFEMLNLHHNMGPGFFLAGGANNLILNCDSHHNYDPKSRAGDGENADGFGCHPRAGDTGNVYRGIRAWWNSDDGFDSINALEACVVENSWAWYNGYLPDTMNEPMRNPATPPGNGNGFKLGGFGLLGTGSPAVPPRHTVRLSLAFLNVYAGFFANYHTSGNIYESNTGFGNLGADFDMMGLNNVNTSVLRNNLAYGPSQTRNMNGTDSVSNSWSLPVTVSEADFQSISIAGMDGPRQADGSLPVLGFMRLVQGSDLIDKGVNINLPYTGAAPDLGAFETGSATGDGGASRDGGGAADADGGGGGGMSRDSGDGTVGQVGVDSGDALGAGGVRGSGGASGVGTGGSPGAGGASNTGGAVSSGGAGGTDGSVPGSTGSAGSTGAQSGSPATTSDTGCSCRVDGQRSPSTVLTAFGATTFLGLAAARRRRRRPQRQPR